MVAANFEPSLKLVLEAEGQNDDDAHDPGGRTSRGVTQREYDAFCKKYHLPEGDVWQAPDAYVHRIYHESYWLPHCDLLPLGVDYLYFDMAVNTGPVQAAKILQRGLGVKDDGHIGIVTMQAALHADVQMLIRVVSGQRRRFYRSLRTFRYFGRGWLKRVDHCEAEAMKMAVVQPA